MLDRPQDNPDAEPKGQVWAFPSRSRCPWPDCGSLDTEAVTTKPPIQYRRCRRCGRSYKVLGCRI